MSDSNNSFILYEYLAFFWKKKWLLILLPLLGIIIGFGVSSFKPVGYIGTLSFYTGEVKKPELTQPQLVEKKFEEYPNLVVNQSGGNISFVISSQDKNGIEEQLTSIGKEYEKELISQSEALLTVRTDNLNVAKKKMLNLEETIKDYNAQINSPNTESELKDSLLTSITKLEQQLFNYRESSNLEEFELLNYGKPTLLSLEVTEESSHRTSNVLLGFVLGLFLSVCFIILWKYVLDAKKVKMS